MNSSSSKNEQKKIIKEHLYLMLKGALSEICEQLKACSERNQLIDNNKWERLINNTFHRYNRKAHKALQEIIKDDKYWNEYNYCINKFIDYIKQCSFDDEEEDTKRILFKIWGGFPKFEIISLNGRNFFTYIVFKSAKKKTIKKVGFIILSLRRRTQSSEIASKNLETFTKEIVEKYEQYPVKELIIYLTPYNVRSFTFDIGSKFKQEQKHNGKNKSDLEKEEETPKKELDETKESLPMEYEWVGKIIQTPTKPMRQGKGTKRVEDIVIEGWLYETYCSLAKHNRYFVAQHPNLGTKNGGKVPKGHRRRMLIKINDYKDWPQNVAHEISDDPKLRHFTQCWFNFERFLDTDRHGSYLAVPIGGTGIDKYKFRNLTPDEYNEVYRLPHSGVPLGLFVHDDDFTVQDYPLAKIPFYFPVNDQNYEQLFYTPTFLVGRPSSGKTNALKAMTAASLSCEDYCSNEKPAFIFFDYEGQFSSLANPIVDIVGNNNDLEVWNLLNINPVDFEEVEVLSSSTDTPAKFSFRELLKGLDVNKKIRILKYFLRTLSDVTENAFDEIARKIFYESDPDTYSSFRKEFQDELNAQTIQASETLTPGQRKAIIRTLQEDITTFFDQTGKSFNLLDLLKPGKVIVFDLKNISKEKAILYVLLELQKLKLEKNEIKSPVIVVIDEAHEIFKHVTGSSKEARYYNLISKFIAEFGSRGRKYRLGLWLASQRPQDLHKDIQKVIGTYMILGLNPEHKRWLTSTLGTSEEANFILKLPNTYALFKNSSLYRGNAYLLKLVKSPNIHRTFV